MICQGTPDDPLERRRHAGAEPVHRLRGLLENGPDHLGFGLAGKRVAAGHHLVEHHPQRPDVHARAGVLAVELLGGHVGRGAHRHAGAGDAGLIDELGDAEVDQLHPPVRGHDDVGRLDVAMDDPPLVGTGQAGGDLFGDRDRLGDRQRSARDPVAQRLPLAESHDDEQGAVDGLVDLMDRADVRMIERRCGLGLADEAPLGFLGGAALMGQELERHRPVELQIDGLVDHPHAASPQAIEDAVVGDRAADHRVFRARARSSSNSSWNPSTILVPSCCPSGRASDCGSFLARRTAVHQWQQYSRTSSSLKSVRSHSSNPASFSASAIRKSGYNFFYVRAGTARAKTTSPRGRR